MSKAIRAPAANKIVEKKKIAKEEESAEFRCTVDLTNCQDFIEPKKLVKIEYRGRFVDSGNGKRLLKGIEREELVLTVLALGAPAEQGNIVDDSLRQIAVRNEVLEGNSTVALGKLGHRAVLVFAHKKRQVNVGGTLPAECIVKQNIFRGAG